MGPDPVSVAYSSSGRSAYVADGADGVAVVSGDPPAVTARVAVGPGASSIRFAPGGRFALVTHPGRDQVSVIDASVNRAIRTVDVEGVPDQVVFTERFAYVRPRENPMVRLIPLDGLADAGSAAVVLDMPSGQHPLGRGVKPCAAAAIAPAPAGMAVLIANSGDDALYYYQEGMSAPSGSFRNANHSPRAVLTVDRSLRAAGPGAFDAVARLRNAGRFDVVVLLDNPRIVHAFGLDIDGDPGRAPAAPAVEIRLAPVAEADVLRAGRSGKVRLSICEQAGRKPVAGRTDVRILAMLPGRWQRYETAEAGPEPGSYAFDLTPPESGTYHFLVECPSAGLPFRNPWSFSLEVKP